MFLDKFKKNKYLKRVIVFAIITALLCNTMFAYVSFSGIESVKQKSISGGDPFVILEIVPHALSGEIGYYISGQEPVQSFVTSEAEYQSRIAQLSATGLYTTDGSAPLGAEAPILPWLAPAEAILIPSAEQTAVVNGTFVEATAGSGAFTARNPLPTPTPPVEGEDGTEEEAIPETPTEFNYVSTGGDYNFVADDAGPQATVYYSSVGVTTGFVNNNWFLTYVLNDSIATQTNVQVISMTPQMLEVNAENPNSLDKIIGAVDMIVMSAGLDIATNGNMLSLYNSNDLSVVQKNLIKGKVAPSDANEKGLPFVFDSRIVSMSGTQVATLVTEVANGKDTSNGYVHQNVYCYSPTPSLSIKRPQMATRDFIGEYEQALYNYSTENYDGSFISAHPYFEVINEIRVENEFRRIDLGASAEPSDYYVPESVTMATAMRQIINYSNMQYAEPEIAFTDKLGTQTSHLLIPTVYSGNSLTGTVLSTATNQNLNFKITDRNTIRTDISVYLYYENANGEFYLDTKTNQMLSFNANTAPTNAQRFSITSVPQDILSNLDGFVNTGAVLENAVYTFDVESSIINTFAAANENDLDMYLQAVTKIGYRSYSKLSNNLKLQKLGLLLLG